MSNILGELQVSLASDGVGTVADDLFTDNMPDTPDNCIAIISVPSPDPDPYVDTQVLVVDIWVRNKKATLADDKLQEIRTILHRTGNWELPSFHVYFSQAVGNIQNMGRDIQSRQLRKLTFKLTYWDTAIIS